MYHAVLANDRVEKQLDRIPNADFQRISRVIRALAENPRPHGSLKLVGTTSLYRIRVGRYRVIYTIDDAAEAVVITKVDKRDEGTYRI